MAPRTTIQIGVLSLTVSQLTLGQLKRVRNEMQTLMALRTARGDMPTVEQLDAMVAVLHVSASVVDATLTREMIVEAVDALAYDVGMTQLAEAIAVVMQTSGLGDRDKEMGVGTGEAAGPAIS